MFYIIFVNNTKYKIIKKHNQKYTIDEQKIDEIVQNEQHWKVGQNGQNMTNKHKKKIWEDFYRNIFIQWSTNLLLGCYASEEKKVRP